MIRPHERIHEKKKSTEEVIAKIESELDAYDVPDYVKELQLSSLQKRLEEIKKEEEKIKRLSDKEELVLTMKPKNLPAGQISVRDFILVIGGLQELSDSIANTIYNQPSEKGKIPANILDKTEMVLKETRAGSFQAILNINHPKQTSLEEPEIVHTMNELFSLFDSSSDEELLAEKISVLGPRALKNYIHWTKAIREMDTPIDLEWRSSYKERASISWDRKNANKIYKLLNNFSDAKEEEVTLQGRLTGANIRTETFEFISEDGERISGRISKEAIPSFISPKFGSNYTIDLIKVMIGHGFKEKVSWTLKNISLLE